MFTGIYQIPFSFQFALQHLAQYTDITNIADRYKITKAVVRLQYNANAVAGSPPSAALPSMLPMVKYVVDYDDASVQSPSNLNARMGVRTKHFGSGNKPITMTVRPKVSALLSTDTGIGFAVPTKATYVNTNNVDVTHYGIRGYIENMSLQDASQVCSCITIDVELHVTARDLL